MKKLKYIKLFENFEEISSSEFVNIMNEFFSEFPYDLMDDDDSTNILFECPDKETEEEIKLKVEEFVEKVVPQKYKNFTFYKQTTDPYSEDGLDYDDERSDLTLVLSKIPGKIDIEHVGPSEILLFSTYSL